MTGAGLCSFALLVRSLFAQLLVLLWADTTFEQFHGRVDATQPVIHIKLVDGLH